MNSSNKTMVPEAQDAMNRFKMEAANEVGVKENPRNSRLWPDWPSCGGESAIWPGDEDFSL